MKKTAIVLFLLFAASCAAQTDNTLYAKQFPGSDVGSKVQNAMVACNPNTAIPCIIVLDPSLAVWAPGTMPSLCSQCSLQDYRLGTIAGGAMLPKSLNNIQKADQFLGATASEKITACLAAAGSNGTCDAMGVIGVQNMDAMVEVGTSCFSSTGITQSLVVSPSTIFQPTVAGMTMFKVDCNGSAPNLNINIPSALSFTGKAIDVEDEITNTNAFNIDNFIVNAGAYYAGGYCLYMAPPTSGYIQLTNVHGGKCNGLANDLYVYTAGTGTYFNGVDFSDLQLAGNGTLLTLNAAAGSLSISGNNFVNLTTDGLNIAISAPGSGPVEGNLFSNIALWDTATPFSFSATAIANSFDGRWGINGGIYSGGNTYGLANNNFNDLWVPGVGASLKSYLGPMLFPSWVKLAGTSTEGSAIVGQLLNTSLIPGTSTVGESLLGFGWGTPDGSQKNGSLFGSYLTSQNTSGFKWYCMVGYDNPVLCGTLEGGGNFTVPGAYANANGTVIPITALGYTGAPAGKVVLSTGTGYSGTCASTTTLTVVNGIITGCS